jgi:hypothetical protein
MKESTTNALRQFGDKPHQIPGIAYRLFVIGEDQVIVNHEELEYMRERWVQHHPTHVPEYAARQNQALP